MKKQNKTKQKIFLLFLFGILLISFTQANLNYSTPEAIYKEFNWNETFSNENFTISSWVKLKDTNKIFPIINLYSYELFIDSENYLILKFRDGTNFSSSTQIELNEFVFVSSVYNGTHVNLYVNNSKTSHSYSSGYYKHSTNFSATIGKNDEGYFNGTLDEIRVFNKSLSDGQINLLYTSNIIRVNLKDWIFTSIKKGLEASIEYIYSFFAKDIAGNIKSTEERMVRGNSAPYLLSKNTFPTDLNEIDPGKEIEINATIKDLTNDLEETIFQWKNSTSEWNNITLNNITEKATETNYSFNFTLPEYEDVITFRFWTNDSLSEIGISEEYNLSSFWDCSWELHSHSLDGTVGFLENKYIGNFTILNTGDSNYSGGCEITFTNNHNNNFSINYWMSSEWASTNRGIQFSEDSFSLSNNENKTISAYCSFPSSTESFTETPKIRITSDVNDTISGKNLEEIETLLIISDPSPLLYQSIEETSAGFIYLTPGSFNLFGYVRNLGSDGTNNTIAHNVTSNWTLDSELASVIESGNLTSLYETLSDNSKQWNNLTFNLTSSNLGSFTKGSHEIKLYSFGYDNESNLIENSGAVTLLENSISLEFVCYSETDGICVDSCGPGSDPDCTLPPTIISTSSRSGGGGGGGSASNDENYESSEDYQLVRGKQNEVKIIFKNKDSTAPLTDLSFNLQGDITKYMEISPEKTNYLSPGGEIELTLKINSPSYLELGKQKLKILMKARKGDKSYSDSKSIFLEIHEISLDEANELVNTSKELLGQLNSSNLKSELLDNLLNETMSAITNFNLEKVMENSEFIQQQATYALEAHVGMSELKELIESAEKKGMDVSESSRLVKLAEISLQRSNFEEAYKRIGEAQLTYALNIKGEIGSLKFYIKEYPKEISLGFFFLFIFGFSSYNLNKLRKIKKKLKNLRKEEKIINDLRKVVQNECFKEKKISMEEYETTILEYNKRLSKIIEQTINLENKRAHMLKFESKLNREKTEKIKIIELIKELQRDYMKNKKIETRTYELKLERFNKRLTEIEERLATLEAKKLIKQEDRKIKRGKLK